MSVHRSTVDLVVLMISGMIAFSVVGGIIGIIVLELARPEIDTTPMIDVEGEILGVLVGALVGFVSGRATGRVEAERDVRAQQPTDPDTEHR